MCWLATDTVSDPRALDPESQRLLEDGQRTKNWKRWGPYLSDRQWGTVREDYSATGEAWDYLPHERRAPGPTAGERTACWASPSECRLCLAVALWNQHDPILKERLYGLNGQGNHGEDVKELYYFLDATPTSLPRTLYKYPQRRVPLHQSHRGEPAAGTDASRSMSFSIPASSTAIATSTSGRVREGRPDDLLDADHVVNRGPEPAPLHVLPTLWFRNTWAWERTTESYWPRPELLCDDRYALARHASLGLFRFEPRTLASGGPPPELLFCDNETNAERLFGVPSRSRWPKDAIHEAVVNGRRDAVNPDRSGTKVAAHYRLGFRRAARPACE